MIDIKKDPKSDSFILTQTKNIEGIDFHSQMSININELEVIVRWLNWNYLEIKPGTNLETALKQLKQRANGWFDWQPHTVFTNFNGFSLTSDMTADEAFKRCLGCTKKEYDEKVEEERKRYANKDKV